MSTPLTAPRRATLVVGGLIVVSLFVQGGLQFIAHTGKTTYRTSSEVAATAALLRIDSGSGDVNVHPGAGDRIHIETTVRYGLRRPDIKQQVRADEVLLQSDCDWFDGACSIDYDVSVPAGVAVEVSAGSGDVRAADLSTRVTLRSGAGDLTVTRVTGNTDLRAGSGDIAARESGSANLSARTGSGDIRAEFVSAPGNVNVRTGSGDVTVRVPASVPYAADVDTGSGDRTVTVPTDPNSPLRLFVRTGSGDARITGG